MAADLTPSESLKHKRQRHEARPTAPELEQPQPEQGADPVYQQSEKTIPRLKEEIQRLRREDGVLASLATCVNQGFRRFRRGRRASHRRPRGRATLRIE